GEPVGQVVVHDVNLTDGSLRLSRTDFSIPGAGPGLELHRSYTNVGHDVDGVLGPGWSHSLDYSLQVLGNDETQAQVVQGDPGLVPGWVQDAKAGPGHALLMQWSVIQEHIDRS